MTLKIKEDERTCARIAQVDRNFCALIGQIREKIVGKQRDHWDNILLHNTEPLSLPVTVYFRRWKSEGVPPRADLDIPLKLVLLATVSMRDTNTTYVGNQFAESLAARSNGVDTKDHSPHCKQFPLECLLDMLLPHDSKLPRKEVLLFRRHLHPRVQERCERDPRPVYSHKLFDLMLDYGLFAPYPYTTSYYSSMLWLVHPVRKSVHSLSALLASGPPPVFNSWEPAQDATNDAKEQLFFSPPHKAFHQRLRISNRKRPSPLEDRDDKKKQQNRARK